MVTYGSTAIPSDQITVLSGGTVAVSLAFENTVGLVGGMDTSNGTATAGEVSTVSSPSDAQSMFGEGSELHEAVQLAYQNGAGEVFCLPVEETTVDAEEQSSQDGSLDNAPIFDPRVNDEHEISVDDSSGGSLEVNYVDEPPTSAPSSEDTVDIYPPTAEYYADAAPDGSNYEFTYDHGDYSSSAMEPLLAESPRIVAVLTENESVTNDLATELNSRAQNFDFMHGVAGATVNVDSASYSNGVDERRITLSYPSRGYTDNAETNEVRTTGAIAGYLASLPLGLSSTNDSIGGFTSLKNPLSGPSDAGTLIDSQVMPLLDYPPVTIVKDMTTSQTARFERVFTMQVVDELTEATHTIAREFVGEQNTATNRKNLRRSIRNALLGAERGTPRLLDDSTTSVSENDSNPNQTDVSIGLDVVDVMDTIDVTITVGDIVRNEGAE